MPAVTKQIFAALSVSGILALGGCATTLPTPSTGDMLSSAGFHMKLADTPQKLALLKKLPPHHFIHKDKNGKTLTVWADPAGCKCLYVGNPAAWETYQQQAFANHIVAVNEQASEQSEEAAMLDDDSMSRGFGWGWNAWAGEPW